jgi:hypothetical protein
MGGRAVVSICMLGEGARCDGTEGGGGMSAVMGGLASLAAAESIE